MLTAVMGIPPRELSPNARVHWAAKARATKRYRYESFVEWKKAIMHAGGWTPIPVELRVEYTHFRRADGYLPMDEENAIAAIKAAIDGMVDAGIVPTDSAKWLRVGRLVIIPTKGKDSRASLRMTVVPQ